MADFNTATGGKPVILIADDSSIERSFLRALFRDEFESVEAINGRDVIDLLRRGDRDYSLLLLGLNMPGVDGWKVLEFLRGNGMIAALPVVVLTASAVDSDTVVELFDAGAWDVHAKPFKEKMLLSHIRSFCSRAAAARNYATVATEQYRATLEGAAAAIFAVDVSTLRIVRSNRRFNMLVNSPRTEGFLLSEVTGAAATVFGDTVRRAVETGFGGPVLVDSLGHGRYDSLYCELMRDAHGAAAFVVGTLTDMTAVISRIRELEAKVQH